MSGAACFQWQNLTKFHRSQKCLPKHFRPSDLISQFPTWPHYSESCEWWLSLNLGKLDQEYSSHLLLHPRWHSHLGQKDRTLKTTPALECPSRIFPVELLDGHMFTSIGIQLKLLDWAHSFSPQKVSFHHFSTQSFSRKKPEKRLCVFSLTLSSVVFHSLGGPLR